MTKLTGITFQSRDDRQAENYRKMMVAMASDIRVILIKLADRLHNMRTIDAMPKSKQQEKAKETLEIFAPLAHRLGIHAIKWELEDLAFATLHPRKYKEIKGLVNQQREEREGYVAARGRATWARSSRRSASRPQISGRAKHFYSIYSKMTKKGREFNEIYDLTAMRVLVGSVKDCYGAIGVIHSLWKPLPGRFKDFVAMPKFNMYQALHTTVIGPEGRPLEIQIRTQEMHDTAEYGIAAHWMYKDGDDRGRGQGRVAEAPGGLAEGAAGPAGVRRDAEGGPVRGRGVRLHAQGRGQVARRRRHAARLRLRGAHRRRPPLRGREGQRQDRAAALRAAVGRHLRGADLQEGARPVAATGCRWPRPPARSPRSAPGSSASAARTPSARAARSSQEASSARACRRRRSPARRCWPT